MARRVLGEGHEIKLTMSWNYARALYENASATLNDVCEAVTTLEETKRKARRVMGRAHPLAMNIESSLRESREALSARDVSSISEAFAAMTRGMRKTIHLLVAKSRITVLTHNGQFLPRLPLPRQQRKRPPAAPQLGTRIGDGLAMVDLLLGIGQSVAPRDGRVVP